MTWHASTHFHTRSTARCVVIFKKVTYCATKKFHLKTLITSVYLVQIVLAHYSWRSRIAHALFASDFGLFGPKLWRPGGEKYLPSERVSYILLILKNTVAPKWVTSGVQQSRVRQVSWREKFSHLYRVTWQEREREEHSGFTCSLVLDPKFKFSAPFFWRKIDLWATEKRHLKVSILFRQEKNAVRIHSQVQKPNRSLTLTLCS